MYRRKVKIIIICSTLAFSLCACNTSESKVTEPVTTESADVAPSITESNDENSATAEPDTPIATDSENSNEPDTISKTTVQSDLLGYAFSFSTAHSDMLVIDNTIVEEEADSMTYEKQAFYLNMNGINQFAFEIWRIKGSYTEEEISNNNPTLIYLGSNFNYSYVMSTIEEVPADLNYEDSKLFKTIMNDEVSTIPDSFTIL